MPNNSYRRNINSPLIANPYSFSWQSPYFGYFTAQIKREDSPQSFKNTNIPPLDLTSPQQRQEYDQQLETSMQLIDKPTNDCQSLLIQQYTTPTKTYSPLFQSPSTINDTTHISCVIDPSDNHGGLYLSDFEFASDLYNLHSHNISAVLSIDRNTRFTLPDTFRHKKIIAFDTSMERISAHFDSTYEFIKEALESKQNILVHCRRGISRSATIIIAFLLRYYSASYEECYHHLLSRRLIIKPNDSFVAQLLAYELILQEYQLFSNSNIPTTTIASRPF